MSVAKKLQSGVRAWSGAVGGCFFQPRGGQRGGVVLFA